MVEHSLYTQFTRPFLFFRSGSGLRDYTHIHTHTHTLALGGGERGGEEEGKRREKRERTEKEGEEGGGGRGGRGGRRREKRKEEDGIRKEERNDCKVRRHTHSPYTSLVL